MGPSLAVIAAGFALWHLGGTHGLRSVMLAGLVLCALALLALVYAAWSRRHTSAVVAPPRGGDVRRGGRAPFEVTLTNTSRLPVALYSANITCSYRDGQTPAATFVLKGSLHGRSTVTLELLLSAAHCGVMRAELVSLATGDPLGFARVGGRLDSHAETPVLPVGATLLPDSLPNRGSQDAQPDLLTATAKGDPSPETRDLRSYQPGDSPKSVHWKLYARSGELLTRLREEEPRVDVVLALNPLCVAVDAAGVAGGGEDEDGLAGDTDGADGAVGVGSGAGGVGGAGSPYQDGATFPVGGTVLQTVPAFDNPAEYDAYLEAAASIAGDICGKGLELVCLWAAGVPEGSDGPESPEGPEGPGVPGPHIREMRLGASDDPAKAMRALVEDGAGLSDTTARGCLGLRDYAYSRACGVTYLELLRGPSLLHDPWPTPRPPERETSPATAAAAGQAAGTVTGQAAGTVTSQTAGPADVASADGDGDGDPRGTGADA